MGRCRFVEPGTVRLPLSDGDFIDVKKELNAGEQRGVFAGMARDVYAGDARTALDPERVGITKLIAYIVGWSLVDAKGQPVPFSEDALNALDFDSYAEIVAAVDAHEAQIEQEREARKNSPATASPS